mmetsp:Transcript_10517/g.19060  ORF Transcript_10517/g.19060 Transcript_10517/m.19060 type:complete len:93 (-) Transcript_10517:45-323(-)
MFRNLTAPIGAKIEVRNQQIEGSGTKGSNTPCPIEKERKLGRTPTTDKSRTMQTVGSSIDSKTAPPMGPRRMNGRITTRPVVEAEMMQKPTT